MPRPAVAYAVVLVMVLLMVAVTGCNDRQRPAASGGDGATASAASAKSRSRQSRVPTNPPGPNQGRSEQPVRCGGPSRRPGEQAPHPTGLGRGRRTTKGPSQHEEAARTLSGKALFCELDVNNPDERVRDRVPGIFGPDALPWYSPPTAWSWTRIFRRR